MSPWVSGRGESEGCCPSREGARGHWASTRTLPVAARPVPGLPRSYTRNPGSYTNIPRSHMCAPIPVVAATAFVRPWQECGLWPAMWVRCRAGGTRRRLRPTSFETTGQGQGPQAGSQCTGWIASVRPRFCSFPVGVIGHSLGSAPLPRAPRSRWAVIVWRWEKRCVDRAVREQGHCPLWTQCRPWLQSASADPRAAWCCPREWPELFSGGPWVSRGPDLLGPTQTVP